MSLGVEISSWFLVVRLISHRRFRPMVFHWSCIALVDGSVKLFEVLFLPASILLVNTPIMKLLVEHVLCILV